ncbi:MAG: hypothetical protein ACLQED_05605 [Desulfobaccales bacterium]
MSDSILIGADTKLASIMARIFIINTIVARVEVGIKDSMASVLTEPLVLEFKAVVAVKAIVALGVKAAVGVIAVAAEI